MDEPPFALVCGWRYPLLIIAKGGSFSTVSTLRLYSSTSIACGFLYENRRLYSILYSRLFCYEKSQQRSLRRTAAGLPVSRYAPSCENGGQESPQTFLSPEIQNILPLNMARARRRPLKSFSTQKNQTRTISGVISASVWAPHICMVSASSPASLSM